jgi:hypothetical protein
MKVCVAGMLEACIARMSGMSSNASDVCMLA